MALLLSCFDKHSSWNFRRIPTNFSMTVDESDETMGVTRVQQHLKGTSLLLRGLRSWIVETQSAGVDIIDRRVAAKATGTRWELNGIASAQLNPGSPIFPLCLSKHTTHQLVFRLPHQQVALLGLSAVPYHHVNVH